MTQRCEPADTARVGLHYIVHISSATGKPNEDPRIARWDGERWNEWWLYSQPYLVWEAGYRYLCPVPTPAEIEALVRAGRAAQQWQERRVSGQVEAAHSTIDDLVLADLTAALAPFGEAARSVKLPISQDRKTQEQVAAILLIQALKKDIPNAG